MKKERSLLIIVALLMIPFGGLFPTSNGISSDQDEIKLILDMDAAPDDLAAMLYLLKHPAISVLGVGVSCGVAYVDAGVDMALGILEHLGKSYIPVAAGKETPLIVEHAFPTPWREGSYNSYGFNLPTTTLQPSSMNASELIISLVENSESNVTLIATGPLTNIAIALETEPSIKSKIDRIHLMGGAIYAPGNVGLESDIPNYVAEWNIWVDPHAADIVFKSGLLISMVSLDATNQVPRTQSFLDRLESVMETPEALLLYEITTPTLYFWDQLAVVSLTNPEVATWEEHCIEIVLDLENQEGKTNSTNTGLSNADVAVSADASIFEDLFIGYINGDLPPSDTTTTSTLTGLPPELLPLLAVGVGAVVVAAVAVSAMKRR
ncbi:MAG: nucleoside hydrolase [Candidatus Thorarchaeota archaeon]|nr:MAG: nucleoside hydrolase [Candidatus Thorarchaeota archaeon]